LRPQSGARTGVRSLAGVGDRNGLGHGHARGLNSLFARASATAAGKDKREG
jgi:hypothetical protein